MEHLQIFQDFLKEKSYQQKLKQANAMFAWQPFAHRYKDIKTITYLSKYFLPIISIATGTAFLFEILSVVIPFTFLAVLLSSIILTLWEFIKASLVQKSFIFYYSKQSFSIGLLVFVLLFSCGSIYVSIQGAKVLHKQFDHSIESLITLEESRKTVLSKAFSAQIDSLQQIRKAYTNSVSYMGKINIHNEANKVFFKNNDERIREVESKKRDALKQQASKTESILKEKRKKQNYNQYTVMILAFCVDMLIILAGWFLVHYPYKMMEEADSFDMSKEYKLRQKELQGFVQHAMRNTNPYFTNSIFQEHNPSTHIGFQRKEQKQNTFCYSDLMTAIKAGERDYRTLCKTYKVNPKMVKECMEKLKV